MRLPHGPANGRVGAMMRAVREIQAQTEHENVRWVTRWSDDMVYGSLEITCARCGESFSVAYTADTWYRRNDWVLDTVVPLGATVMRTKCHPLTGRQMTQDLVVSWLATAGEAGLPWARVLGKLLLLDIDDYSEAGDILYAVNRLELEEWEDPDLGAMIRLPEGHPDRTW